MPAGHPAEDLDIHTFADGANLGAYVVADEEALSPEQLMRGAWLELPVEDVEAAARALAGLQTFYSDPNFAKAFGALFSAPAPQPEIFVHQPSWHEWGDMTSGDSHTTYYFVIARGKLKETDATKAQQAHDAVAAAGESTFEAASDVAHVVYTGLADPREFLAVDIWVDIWKDSTNLAATYSDPNFAKGFAALFEGTPSIAVYASTDWHQW